MLSDVCKKGELAIVETTKIKGMATVGLLNKLERCMTDDANFICTFYQALVICTITSLIIALE